MVKEVWVLSEDGETIAVGENLEEVKQSVKRSAPIDRWVDFEDYSIVKGFRGEEFKAELYNVNKFLGR